MISDHIIPSPAWCPRCKRIHVANTTGVLARACLCGGVRVHVDEIQPAQLAAFIEEAREAAGTALALLLARNTDEKPPAVLVGVHYSEVPGLLFALKCARDHLADAHARTLALPVPMREAV